MSDTITPQTPESRDSVEETQPTGSVSLPETVTALDIKQYFNMMPYMDNDMVSWIVGYTSSRGVISKGDVFTMLRQVESRLGTTSDRLSGVYNYLKVQSQIEDLSKVKNSLENAY